MFIGRATRPQALILLNLKISPAARTCGLDLCSEAFFIFFRLAVYKSGTGTRGRGPGDGDIATRVWGLGTWGRETSDLRTSSMGRGDVWDGDVGTSNTGTQGTRYLNDSCKSRR